MTVRMILPALALVACSQEITNPTEIIPTEPEHPERLPLSDAPDRWELDGKTFSSDTIEIPDERDLVLRFTLNQSNYQNQNPNCYTPANPYDAEDCSYFPIYLTIEANISKGGEQMYRGVSDRIDHVWYNGWITTSSWHEQGAGHITWWKSDELTEHMCGEGSTIISGIVPYFLHIRLGFRDDGNIDALVIPCTPNRSGSSVDSHLNTLYRNNEITLFSKPT